jgi:DNA-binding LacI/PurR family transcriptional regulator
MSQTELAKLAFKALLTEVNRDSPSANGTEYTLETDLVLRKSTALASKSKS